jgi:5-methylcytosine-specific restriction endonuclease McrA
MLVEDTSAFIEHLEVRQEDKRVEKRRQRLAQAELGVMRLEVEARLTEQALRAAAHELAAIRTQPVASSGRRLARARRERSLAREVAGVRSRLRETRELLQARRVAIVRLRTEATKIEGAGGSARLIRLHSAHHHLEYSERRFLRLARSQLVLPVLVGKRDGRRWWWYSDRFWWDDSGLSAREVAVIVRRADLTQQQRADELARAREDILGEGQPRQLTQAVSPVVRLAVWCRDRGRCVDCRVGQDLGYDQIVPFSRGGWRWIANVELRCDPCRERRASNQERARVRRAQIDAASLVR